MILVGYLNAANEYYSTASHHEQKNHKTTGQIKFLAVTIKKHIKPSYNILYVNRYYVYVQMLLLHSFIYCIFCLVKKLMN